MRPMPGCDRRAAVARSRASPPLAAFPPRGDEKLQLAGETTDRSPKESIGAVHSRRSRARAVIRRGGAADGGGEMWPRRSVLCAVDTRAAAPGIRHAV